MSKVSLNRLLTEFAFLIGVLCCAAGPLVLLIGGETSFRFSTLISILCIVVGIVLAKVSLSYRRTARYMFLASLTILSGFFFLLVSTKALPYSLAQIWPAFGLCIGLALLPTGYIHDKRISARYLVPVISFVALSLFLLLFSFDLIQFSLRHFIGAWWPLIVALAGIILVLLTLVSGGNDPDARK